MGKPERLTGPHGSFLLLCLTLAGTSCARRVQVPADQYSTLASYARDGTATVHDGRQRPFTVTPDMEPEVTATGQCPCTGFEYVEDKSCTYEATAPLEWLLFTPHGGVAVAPRTHPVAVGT